MDLDPNLIAAVKSFEGFTPKAQWDYKQHSNGYGTKAAAPGEVIDQPTAEARLQSELGKVQAQVDGFAPNLPSGARNALASLTFNAGPGWMNSGLGAAVKSGDLGRAQQIFLSYNKAGGEVSPGLVQRRAQEAQWFGAPQQIAQAAPAPFQAIPAAAAPAGMPLFGGAGAGGAVGADQAASRAPPNPGSIFGQMVASSGPPPVPMAFPQQQMQRPPIDMSRLMAFLQSQQIQTPGG